MKQLYDFQFRSVEEIVERLPFPGNVIFLAPTGYGKTLVALEVYKRWREIWMKEKGMEKAHLYVCVPRRDLMKQWGKEAKEMGLTPFWLPEDTRIVKKRKRKVREALNKTDVFIATPKAGVSFLNYCYPQFWDSVCLCVIDEIDFSSALDLPSTLDSFRFKYRMNKLYEDLYEVLKKKGIKTLGISATIGRDSREAAFLQQQYNAEIIWKEFNFNDVGIERIDINDPVAGEILGYLKEKLQRLTEGFTVLKSKYGKREKRRILAKLSTLAYKTYKDSWNSEDIEYEVTEILSSEPEVIETFYELCQYFAYITTFLRVRSCFSTDGLLQLIEKFEREKLIEFPETLKAKLRERRYLGKMQKIIELSQEAFRSGKRYIFFSSYKQPLEEILRETEKIDVEPLYESLPPELLYQQLFSGRSNSLSQIVSIYHGSRRDGKEQLDAFQRGETQILLTTVAIAQRGFNLPSDMAFLIEPIKDLRLITQIRGRTRGGKIGYLAYPNEGNLKRTIQDITLKILQVLKYAY